MEITSSTYWYVKKYLAHKIAFEDDVKVKARYRWFPMKHGKKGLGGYCKGSFGR